MNKNTFEKSKQTQHLKSVNDFKNIIDYAYIGEWLTDAQIGGRRIGGFFWVA